MISGYVHPDFACVAAALSRQLPAVPGAGAAVCVYFEDERVVDIWAGERDGAGQPWERDTVAPSFSTGKGVAATLLHRVMAEHELGYDEPVARHWPEFASAGKERITIRQALCHEAGLYRISALLREPAEMLNWPAMVAAVARARPHEGGVGVPGYHAISFGWLIGGLIERLTGLDFQQALERYLVTPLSLAGMYFGLPDDQLGQRAWLVNGQLTRPDRPQGVAARLASLAERALAVGGVHLDHFRDALLPFGAGARSTVFDWNAQASVQAVIPAANGQFSARALARMYAMLAAEGRLAGRRWLALDQMREIEQVQSRRRDRVVAIPMHWRLGYHRAFVLGRSVPTAFGHYGYGGSGALCDPDRRLAVAMVLNSGKGTTAGDSRMPTLARAAFQAVDGLRDRRRSMDHD